jgi:hypothetical protein
MAKSFVKEQHATDSTAEKISMHCTYLGNLGRQKQRNMSIDRLLIGTCLPCFGCQPPLSFVVPQSGAIDSLN